MTRTRNRLEALALPASRKAPPMSSNTPKPEEQPSLPFEAPAKALPTRAPVRPSYPPARASHDPYPTDRPYVVEMNGAWRELRHEPGDSYPTPPMLPTSKTSKRAKKAPPVTPTTPAPSSATSTPPKPEAETSTPNARPEELPTSAATTHHHPTEGPSLSLYVGPQLCEVFGFMSALAEARTLRPDLPREAWVKAGRVRRSHFDPHTQRVDAAALIKWAEHVNRGGR